MRLLGQGFVWPSLVGKRKEIAVSLTKQRSKPLFKGKLDSINVAKCAVGRCLLATETIRRGTALGRVTGQVVSDEDYGSEYCMDLSDGTVLEPAAPFRYLNHACEPNCELILWRVPREGKKFGLEIWVHSLQKLVAGEELTIDYGWPADMAIPCQCKSANCRQWVVAEEELAFIKKRRRKTPK
jgi:hypothetical protein